MYLPGYHEFCVYTHDPNKTASLTGFATLLKDSFGHSKSILSTFWPVFHGDDHKVYFQQTINSVNLCLFHCAKWHSSFRKKTVL